MKNNNTICEHNYAMKIEKKLTLKNFCTNHTEKMKGMISLSTACLCNRYCMIRKKLPGSICEHCYACAMAKRYTALNKKLVENYDLLTNEDIAIEDMPALNVLICRLESFGDIANIQQVKNYFTLCNANPKVQFTLWTKNPTIIKSAMEFYGIDKPENLIIIQSSIMVNKVSKVHHDFVDKVFTVYDKEHAEKVDINCGARSCATCQRCYKKTNDIEYVNELIK